MEASDKDKYPNQATGTPGSIPGRFYISRKMITCHRSIIRM